MATKYFDIMKLILTGENQQRLEEISREAEIIAVQKSQPVESSVMYDIAYDSQSRILTIEFNSGSVYQYFNVSQEIYDAFLNAPSKGRFLNTIIKQGFFPFFRVN